MSTIPELKESLNRHRMCLRRIIQDGILQVGSGVLTRESFQRDLATALGIFNRNYDSLDGELAWDLFYDYLDLFKFKIRDIRLVSGLPVFEIAGTFANSMPVMGIGSIAEDMREIEGLHSFPEYGFIQVFVYRELVSKNFGDGSDKRAIIGRGDFSTPFLAGVFDSWFDEYTYSLLNSGLRDYVLGQLGEVTGLTRQGFVERMSMMRVFLRDHQERFTVFGS